MSKLPKQCEGCKSNQGDKCETIKPPKKVWMTGSCFARVAEGKK